ncbi:hypothetical protein [Actinomadura macra]|uniref:hypothetical protein n=1 Tax=Actinomadura macra TaxID=46164 RepID=UPI00083292F3|nr:hypothetical protein [Actinomadura macra]
MATLTQGAVLGAALFVLTACGSDSPGTGRPCTLIGSLPGVGVDIRPPFAARVASASLRVCWNGTCRRPRIELSPSSTSVSTGCDGGELDAACGASASPDGGKTGFARVTGLPKKPVRIFLVLRDARGRKLLDRRVGLTPKPSFPNGPHCGEGDPQAGLVVAGGRITVR